MMLRRLLSALLRSLLAALSFPIPNQMLEQVLELNKESALRRRKIEYVDRVEYREASISEPSETDYKHIARMFEDPAMVSYLYLMEQRLIKRMIQELLTNEKEAIKTSGEITLLRFLRAYGMIPSALEKKRKSMEQDKLSMFNELSGLGSN